MTPLKTFRLPFLISSWVTFAVALTLYWITSDPDVSYWDCPEYVTVASKMEVGHPPGNPIWMLAMRVATIPFPAYMHAWVINRCSGLLMAFAALFLCRVIFIPTVCRLKVQRYPNPGLVASLVSVGASLCFALCDSAWFSAVEAEVYAMSTFLSGLSLWIMVIWWWEKSEGARTRLLILLAYITGISLGVHQLNLLLIPVFALIVFYRYHPWRVNPAMPFLVVVVFAGLLAFLLLGFMPGLLFSAQAWEIFCVNALGMFYDSGVLVFCGLLCVVFLIFLSITHNFYHRLRRVNTSLWMIFFIVLGFSSFGMIMIRAKANPPMNEGNPSNIFSLASYIAREQYPSSPLVYGHTPYSKPLFEERIIDGTPSYSKYILEKEHGIYQPVSPGMALYSRSGLLSRLDTLSNEKVAQKGHGYVVSDYRFHQLLTPELDMWFPRITSRNMGQLEAYSDWAGMTQDNMLKVSVSETVDANGNYLPRMYQGGARPKVFSYKPTYAQNLSFFWNYQSYYMYFRYLFWNFIGRQNDYPSMGEIEHGNFVTGIPWIDSRYLGVTDEVPAEIWNQNKGRNRYFGIPFLIGVLGILWLAFNSRHSRRILWVVTLLFLMTGLAIVVYLNQSPGEPRERDYTFLVSYMAFAMWIAAGSMAIISEAGRFGKKYVVIAVSILVALAPPTLMALENFDDHDRRGRYQTSFFTSSLLDFEIPAIIFLYGDNTSFPIWYATEVLGQGSRHLPVDITYLSLPSYVVNLKNNGLKTKLSIPQMAYGKYQLTRIPSDSASAPLPFDKALEWLYNSEATIPQFPSSMVTVANEKGDSLSVNLRELSGGSSYLPFRQLMLLDLMATESQKSQPRVLFFPSSIEYKFYKSLKPLLRPALFGMVYAPGASDSIVDTWMVNDVRRELAKLRALPPYPKYADPLIQDRERRYRGEMVIAAQNLLQSGNLALADSVARVLWEVYPYDRILPGTFTMADSTFYEGKEYLSLLRSLQDRMENSGLEHDDSVFSFYSQSAYELDSLMYVRQQEWLRYYRSLPARQRTTLSSRSLRLLTK